LADSQVTGAKSILRIGLGGLMVVIACCALISWAGISIRDHLEGYQPLRAIGSGDAIERRRAAQDLSNQKGINSEVATAALIDTLSDANAGVRSTAAVSLASVVSRLRDSATTPAETARLKQRIEIATRELVRLLSDPDPGVRAAAAVGLGALAKGASPGSPTTQQLAALKDESNAVRRQAARRIYGFPVRPLPPELVAALQDRSAEVRAAAARALVHFGPDLDPEIPALMTMLERDEPLVRLACSQALYAAWPTPALAPTLIAALKSPDRGVRLIAAELLGRIGPEARGAIPALIAVLKEPFTPGVYTAGKAARALGQMGPSREAVAALVEVIAANKLVWRIATPPAIEAIGLPAAVALPDLNWEPVRIDAAIHGLGDIGPPAAEAVPALIAGYRKALETEHSLAQVGIPEALERIAPNSPWAPDAVAVLIRALDAKDRYIRLKAVDALGQFGKDAAAAIPRLRTLRDGADPGIRNAAVKSLAGLGVQVHPNGGESPTAGGLVR
jgi:HEAT repeat protein